MFVNQTKVKLGQRQCERRRRGRLALQTRIRQ